MQATVTKRFNIDAAHYLPGYPGKCANLHGHRWEISVSVTGEIDSDGFVMDFSELKRLVVKPLEDQFDHKCLNDCHPFSEGRLPTAENLADYILGLAISSLARFLGVWVSSVSVAETPDNIATVRTD